MSYRSVTELLAGWLNSGRPWTVELAQEYTRLTRADAPGALAMVSHGPLSWLRDNTTAGRTQKLAEPAKTVKRGATFEGNPCARCGARTRYVKGGACLTCMRARNRSKYQPQAGEALP